MERIIFSRNKITQNVIIISFVIAIMYLARFILVPLAFSMLLSMLLYPACDLLERKLPRIVSISIILLIVILLISGIFYFFGTKFYHLFEKIKGFEENILTSINKFMQILENKIFSNNLEIQEMFKSRSKSYLGSSNFIESTILTSTSLISSLVLIFVYTFLFLLYRTSFKKLILYHFPEDKISYASDLLKKIRKVAQNYFFGLAIIILLLGTLNGLGLWIIGLDYPFLFGYFAAMLAIIPYIGTFIGGLLPVLYALVNHDNIWTAVFVLGWYSLVQTIEGNFLTPKIVGSKVSLNPLIAILALIAGGLIWGIAGVILFIPLMAIVKVIFDNVDSLKPYGLMLGSDFYREKIPLSGNRKSDKKE
ncbi:MAG: AI-2E family transporter [Bacteroidales bacterium]